MENENGNNRPKDDYGGPKHQGTNNNKSGPWERQDQNRYGQGYQPYHYPYYQHGYQGTQAQGHQTGQGRWGWGWYYTPSTAQRGGKKPKPKRSSKPAVAGALLVIAGLVAILFGGVLGTMFLNVGPMSDFERFDNMDTGIGNIRGAIIYQNMSPAGGVTISVVDTGQYVITNATGRYLIIGVDEGWHDIKVEKSGYRTIYQSVDVKEIDEWTVYSGFDQETVVDFQLQPGAGDLRIGTQRDDSGHDQFSSQGMGFMKSLGTLCIALSIIFGAITVLGGFFAFKRSNFAFVAVAAVFGIFSLGAGLSTLLSVIALFILMLSIDEFDRPKKKRRGRRRRRRRNKRKGRQGPNQGPANGMNRYGYVNAPRYNGPYYMNHQYQPNLYNPRWIPPGPGKY